MTKLPKHLKAYTAKYDEIIELLGNKTKNDEEKNHRLAIEQIQKEINLQKYAQEKNAISEEITEINEASPQIEILKTGAYNTGCIGDTRIYTDSHLNQIIQNFTKKIGTTSDNKILMKAEHYGSSEAMGWITGIEKNGDTLFASIEWTDKGKEVINNKEYRFVSVELAKIFSGNDGKIYNDVLTAVALTNQPVITDLKAIEKASKQKKTINLTLSPMNAIFTEMNAKESITQEEFDLLSLIHKNLSEDEQETCELNAFEKKITKKDPKADEIKALESKLKALKEDNSKVVEEKNSLEDRIGNSEKEMNSLKIQMREDNEKARLTPLVASGQIKSDQLDSEIRHCCSLTQKQADFHFDTLSKITASVDFEEKGHGGGDIDLNDKLDSAKDDSEHNAILANSVNI